MPSILDEHTLQDTGRVTNQGGGIQSSDTSDQWDMRIYWHDKKKSPRQTRRSLDNATEENAEEICVKTHSPFRAGQRFRGQQYLEVCLFTLSGLLQLQSHVVLNVLLTQGGVAQRRARGQNKPSMK